MKDWVFGVGPTSAKLMVVGEALSKNDEALRKPFVGASGELLTELLQTAGLSRNQVYITNVVKIRPPNNDLQLLASIENEQTGKGYKIEDFLPLLANEIEALNPNCILALGSLACKILTGREGIRNWRGSILPLNSFCEGKTFSRDTKVIPTIHPAALFERNYKEKNNAQGMFTWKQKAHVQFDTIKAVRESKSPVWNIPKRSIEIIRSSIQLDQFFNMYKDYERVYVDTEVFKAHLVCIGFAFTPFHGCSIPLVDLQDDLNYKGIPLNELTDIWQIVAEKLANNNLKKVGQNFKGDIIYWLETAGFKVNGFVDDTMLKMHTLSPELPKSQAFQCSIFTNSPFYKFEGKEYNPFKDRIDVLLHYNGWDCVINCECDQEMSKDLTELGLDQFHKEFVTDLMPIYMGMERKGWKIDLEKRKELDTFYVELLKEKKQELADLLTELGIEGEYNYNSPDQVDDLIYEKMKCVRRKDTAEQTLTALMNNAVKDVRKKKVIGLVLELRSISKMISTYIRARVDPDGRMRWSYNQVGTETGRTSTSTIKKPARNGVWGTGIQLIPRPDEFGGRIREMYVADPGKILFEMDQSQAEARIVALLANDLDLLALFDILDVHKLTAAFCYGLAGSWGGPELIKKAVSIGRNPEKIKETFPFLDLIQEDQRDVGKAARHGLGYNLGEEGLSIKMKISLYRAKQTFLKVHEMSPNLKGVYHEDIQAALANNNKTMFTPFGRRREFFEKWGNELFREAYAHYPQSTIGDNTKRAIKGIVQKEKVDWIEMLAETHDAFISQIPEGREKEAYEICKPIFEQPIDFEKGTIKRPPIIIPIDCKVGYNWGQMKKVKF